MWTVDSQDFVRLLDSTGIPFTKFLDSLIQAQGYILGVGESSILTCQRNVRDGGVDTEVTIAMPGDTSGFLRDYPTCWQYKGRRARDITDAELVGELKGNYVRTLIQKGYAYRFAICDEISAPKRAEWKEKLAAEIHAINPAAPAPEIVTPSQFASWANAYPSVLAEHFGFDTGKALHFAAWSRNTRSVTPDFVMIDRWEAAVARIERHVNFEEATTEAALSLQGMAGVGKTRLVYEIVATKAGRKELVLYAPEGEDAEDIALALANNTKTRCILVADECPAASRLKIAKILKGHRDRVRVICIDNAGERRSDNEELWLSDLEARHVEEVLAKNFPHVLIDRRREYASFSRGYIRFAADLCEHDAEIQSKGHIGPGLAARGISRFSSKACDAVNDLSVSYAWRWERGSRSVSRSSGLRRRMW